MIKTMLNDFAALNIKKIHDDNEIIEVKDLVLEGSHANFTTVYYDKFGFEKSFRKSVSLLEIMAFIYDNSKK